MTAIATIQRDVSDIKRALLPAKPPRPMLVTYPWDITQPHGKHGYQIVVFTAKGFIDHYDAVDAATERQILSKYYATLPKYVRRSHMGPGEAGVDWSTLDTFLASRVCHCGRFGHV